MKNLLTMFLLLSLPLSALADMGMFYDRCIAEQDKGNYLEAKNFCIASSSFGFSPALLVLGHMHLSGELKDLNKAAQYYEQFAKSCDSSAAYGFSRLGHLALEKNEIATSYMWFHLCEQSEYSGCDASIAKVAKILSSKEIGLAVAEANQWVESHRTNSCTGPAKAAQLN